MDGSGCLPRYFVSYGEDISLCVEVLSHANFSQVDDGHDTDVQGEQWFAFFVSRDHGDAVASAGDGMRLQSFGLCP